MNDHATIRQAIDRILLAARKCSVCLPRDLREAIGQAHRLPRLASDAARATAVLRRILDSSRFVAMEAPVELFRALDEAEADIATRDVLAKLKE